MTYRSWLSVVGWDGVINVEENPWLVTSVDAWDRYQWSGRAAPATSDRHLSAGNIELSTAERRGGVQRDRLHADEVPGKYSRTSMAGSISTTDLHSLSVGQVLRDRKANSRNV